MEQKNQGCYSFYQWFTHIFFLHIDKYFPKDSWTYQANELTYLSESFISNKIGQKKTSNLQKGGSRLIAPWFTSSTLFGHAPILHERWHPYSFRQVFWLAFILLSATFPTRKCQWLYMQISSRSQRRDRGWFSQPSLLFLENNSKICFQETWNAN